MNRLDRLVEDATATLHLAIRGRVEKEKLAAYGESQRQRRF